MLDDAQLDLLDRHRVLVDVEHARLLARRRADAAGEFREVVGRVQELDGLFPTVAVDQVVPLGNDVAQRATFVAEGDAAVHAAGGLLLELLLREMIVDLAPVLEALLHGTPWRHLPLNLDETGDLAHVLAVSPQLSAISPSPPPTDS